MSENHAIGLLLVAILIVLGFCALFCGCESSGGGDESTPPPPPSQYEAAWFNDPLPGADPEGTVKVIQTTKDDMIAVTAGTHVQRQADSCHGYDNATIAALRAGDVFDAVLLSVVPDLGRQSIEALQIKIHNPDCYHVEYYPVVVAGSPTPSP